MTTAQDIFDIAVCLMDEQQDASGETLIADTKTYALRTPSLLNSLLDRCLPASDTMSNPRPGRRPVCQKVRELADPVDLDERICTGVLPYGLAGLLLSEEDPTRANFFWQTFLEQLQWATHGLTAVEEDVTDVYGSLEFGEFGAWA